jgi:hypothetical protein
MPRPHFDRCSQCGCMSSLAAVERDAPCPLAAACRLRSSAVVCGRLLSSAVVCRRLLSSAVVCRRLPSSTVVCGRLLRVCPLLNTPNVARRCCMLHAASGCSMLHVGEASHGVEGTALLQHCWRQRHRRSRQPGFHSRSAAPTADSAVPLDRQADEMMLRLIARVPDKPMSRCCRPMQHATHTTTHANTTHCSCSTHDTLFVRRTVAYSARVGTTDNQTAPDLKHSFHRQVTRQPCADPSVTVPLQMLTVLRRADSCTPSHSGTFSCLKSTL